MFSGERKYQKLCNVFLIKFCAEYIFPMFPHTSSSCPLYFTCSANVPSTCLILSPKGVSPCNSYFRGYCLSQIIIY